MAGAVNCCSVGGLPNSSEYNQKTVALHGLRVRRSAQRGSRQMDGSVARSASAVYQRPPELAVACRVFRKRVWRSFSAPASPFANCAVILSRGINKSSSAFLRSEEHTSELQSLRHLVCRLL